MCSMLCLGKKQRHILMRYRPNFCGTPVVAMVRTTYKAVSLILLLARYVPNVAKEELWDQCKKYEYWRPTDDQRPTDLRAHSHILEKFQMAITLQRVNRSPSCLILGWGFRGRRIERRHFRLNQIQYGSRRPFWNKIKRPYLWNALSDSRVGYTLSSDFLMTVDAYRMTEDCTRFTSGGGN